MTSAPELHLPARLSAPRQARRWVGGRLADLGLEPLEELVLLLTSEVVTNAVTHAGTESLLRVERSGTGVKVEVHDGSDRPPVVREHSPQALEGRGVALLEDLADGWGWAPDDDGKTVWFCVHGPRGARSAGGEAPR
jgi:anti-sigma regulatory factor (Ser/Thr protein kinase)